MHRRMGRRLVAGAASLALLGLVGCDPPPPPVATFLVDVATDGADADPGDGACADASGGCSLRAALTEAGPLWDPAVDHVAARPVVEVAPGVDPVLGAALPDAGGTVIRGGGATIDADGVDRPLQVCDGAVLVEDLTLTGAGADGGAVHDLGCARSGIGLRGVTLSGNAGWARVRVEGSTITGGSGGIRGGDASLDVVASTIADVAGPGIVHDTGATAVVTSTISGTTDPLTLVGPLTLFASEVVDNSGGISVTVSPTTAGGFEIVGSLVADNGAGIVTGVPLRVRSSTISGNAGPVDVTTTIVGIIESSTIVDNGTDGQLAHAGTTWLVVQTSILGGTTPACPAGGPNISSNGWNIVTDTSCALPRADDLQRVDPLLGPLTDVGGPTRVRVPDAGSATIDRVPTTSSRCEDASDDQTGTDRPQGAGCDVGAVEQSGI
jgi:hypothetical protein